MEDMFSLVYYTTYVIKNNKIRLKTGGGKAYIKVLNCNLQKTFQ